MKDYARLQELQIVAESLRNSVRIELGAAAPDADPAVYHLLEQMAQLIVDILAVELGGVSDEA